MAKTNTDTTKTDHAAVSEAYLRFRRLEREHASIVALDPSRGDVSYSRGELTVARNAALADVRQLADAVLDAD
jgi:hypothetical protein